MKRLKLSAYMLRMVILYLCIAGLLFWRAYNKGLSGAEATGIGISIPLLAFLMGHFLKKWQRKGRKKEYLNQESNPDEETF